MISLTVRNYISFCTIVLVASCLVGCKDKGQCVPGEQQTCTCPSGLDGAQYCTQEKKWDLCLGCSDIFCGNGTCDATETTENCLEDCPSIGECGDAHVDPVESCDATNHNGHDCTTLGDGYTGGSLSCTASCQWDTSGCVTLPNCGDGALDSEEVCDGEDYDSQTCADFGYTAGRLACKEDCSAIILSGCHSTGTCGNDVLEGLEECDGANLQGLVLCTDLDTDFTGGQLSCNEFCTFDLSGCLGDLCLVNELYDNGYCDPCELYGGTHDPDCDLCAFADDECISWRAPYLGGAISSCEYVAGVQDPDCGVCGDGAWDYVVEQCDGNAMPPLVECSEFGFTGGQLGCLANCTIDVSGCSHCGNGVLDGPEVCDGNNLNGTDCTDHGFTGGTLECRATCDAFDVTSCSGGCGNGIVEGAEVCDGSALGGLDCASQGYAGGALACLSSCDGLDTSSCYDPFIIDTSHAFSWVDISSTGQSVALGDDDFGGPYQMGFVFNYFGNSFSDFYIGSNGIVTFGTGSSAYDNACPISTDVSLPDRAILLMWDDLIPSWYNDLVYQESFVTCPVGPSEPCLIVQFDNYHHFDATLVVSAGTFEAVLFQSGSVLMQFLDAGDLQGASSSTGLKGPSGEVIELGCDTPGYLTSNLAICFFKPGSGGC